MAKIAEVKLRREKVKKLLLRGHRSYAEMALQLKVSLRTVSCDVKAVLPEIEKEIEKMSRDVETVLKDFLKQMEGAFDAAWAAHDRAGDNTNAKIKALRIIRDILCDKVKIMQSLGIIRELAPAQREPIKVEFVDPEWMKDGYKDKIQAVRAPDKLPPKSGKV